MNHIPKRYNKLLVSIILFISIVFIVTKTNYAKEMEKKISILPIGDIEEDVLLHTRKELEDEFNLQVVIEEAVEYSNYAYSKRRKQHSSTQILDEIYKIKPPECGRVLGIIDVDLYVPELTFVFGEADITKQIAIISLTRLRQGFDDLPEDIILFKERTITEAVHELGHTYGLRHCENKDCVMYFSSTLGDTDQKGPNFCNTCKDQLNQIRHLRE